MSFTSALKRSFTPKYRHETFKTVAAFARMRRIFEEEGEEDLKKVGSTVYVLKKTEEVRKKVNVARGFYKYTYRNAWYKFIFGREIRNCMSLCNETPLHELKKTWKDASILILFCQKLRRK